MTPATAQNETPTHPVAARLKAAGIAKVAIIDDVFDPLRRDDMISEIGDFWNAIERDADRMAELKTVVPDLGDKDDITDEVLNKLWERRADLPTLAIPLADQLFAQRIIDIAPLEELIRHLEEAGVEPVPLGSEDPLPESFKLVFLDWLLGRGPGTSASHISEERARTLYTEYEAAADKPFIVLMSSKPTEAAAAKDHFRGASSLLGGLFGFVAKDELKDECNSSCTLPSGLLTSPPDMISSTSLRPCKPG